VILGAAWWFYDNYGTGIPGGGGKWFTLAMTAFALLVWIFRGMETAPKAPEEEIQTVSNNFGSASFQSPMGRMDPQDGEKVWNGIFFGMSSSPMDPPDPGLPILSKPENHTLIVARTRTGKGTRVICPTLLRYGLGRTGASCIVIDPKGENTAITARARMQKQHVQVMNPWGELASTYAALGLQSATFNPLDVLDRHDPNAVAIAQALAGAICPQEQGGKDGYWNESASSLVTAVLLWLTDQPDETKTLARMREIVTLTRREMKDNFLLPMMASEAFGGAIREHASPFIDLAPETYSAITNNIGRFTKFMSDPQIKAATATSSFSMSDLTGAGKDRPTTLYLVIPPDRVETQRTWLRLMITAAMATFKRKPAGSKYRCLFLIDEFPALGKIEGLEEAVATMAGYGVDFCLIIQDFAQLKKIYGEGHHDIISNCAYKWFCNIDDLSTAEYLSKTLGKKTIAIKNRGENKGSSYGDKSHSRSEGESISYSETGRDLLTPDEVLNSGPNTAILLWPGRFPQYLFPVDYWKLQATFEPFRNVAPAMYWPMVYDLNPYRSADNQQHSPDTLGAKPKPAPAGPPARSNYNPGAYSPTSPAPAQPAATPRPINLSTYAPKGPEDAPEQPPKSNYNPNTYSPKDPDEK